MNYNYYSEMPTQKTLQPDTNINNTSNNNTNNNNNTSNNENKKQNDDLSYRDKIKNFLLTPTGTLLVVAFGISIGNAFKDFVSSFVLHILEPIIILLVSKTYLNKYYDLTSFISTEENVINIKLFFSSFLTFLLVVITVYIIHNTFIRSL